MIRKEKRTVERERTIFILDSRLFDVLMCLALVGCILILCGLAGWIPLWLEVGGYGLWFMGLGLFGFCERDKTQSLATTAINTVNTKDENA